MQEMIPALTQRQQFWLKHIQACEASGKSMAEYAASKGIVVRAMYSGRKALIKKGVLPAEQPARFQRVQMMEATVSSQWCIGGVSVAFAGEVDAKSLSTVLSVSATLE